MEMPKTKFEAMCREFPFVRNHAFYNLKNILISRADSTLLNKGSMCYYVGCILDERKKYCYAYFLDKNGDSVYNLGEVKFVWWKFWTWFDRLEEETIERAYKKIGSNKAKNVYFVVIADQDNRIITIYKFPNKMNMEEWIEHEITTEQKKIQDNLELINAGNTI